MRINRIISDGYRIQFQIFSPTETFDDPLIIELLYLQIVQDVFSSIDIRISEAERTNMKIFLCKFPSFLPHPIFSLASHGVSSIVNIHLIKSSAIKKEIIEQARQWSIYFCRFYPISSSSNDIEILGLSHSGIRLIKRTQTIIQVLETFSFEIIQRVTSNINESTMSFYFSKKKLTIHSTRVGHHSIEYLPFRKRSI